uniref:Uncharacterized protein n=1 Tax=Romanomermis culicivorax TaxID=13658 RepID=A0A915HX44_ROMCU
MIKREEKVDMKMEMMRWLTIFPNKAYLVPENSVQEVRAEANSDSSHSHSLCKSDEENEDIDKVVICENDDC